MSTAASNLSVSQIQSSSSPFAERRRTQQAEANSLFLIINRFAKLEASLLQRSDNFVDLLYSVQCAVPRSCLVWECYNWLLSGEKCCLPVSERGVATLGCPWLTVAPHFTIHSQFHEGAGFFAIQKETWLSDTIIWFTKIHKNRWWPGRGKLFQTQIRGASGKCIWCSLTTTQTM